MSSSAWANDLAIPYKVSFRGVDDGELRQALRDASDAVELIRHPPPSETMLRRRAERDLPQLMTVLRAHAYYAAQIELDVITDRKPARVIFRVDTGPVYPVERVDLEPADGAEAPARPLEWPAPRAVGLAVGEPALAQNILDAEEALVRAMQRQGHPFARMTERTVVVVHTSRSVNVTYRYDPGPYAHFGPATISGLRTVRERYIRRRIPWKPGDPYNGDLVRRSQRRLAQTELFSTVRVLEGDALDADGRVPVRVDVSERKHRTLGAGVSYKSDVGAGVKTTWEHRNLFHRGERLTLDAGLTEIGYSGEGRFRKPDFLHVDQAVTLTLRGAVDEPDAYESRSLGASIIVDRELGWGIVLGGGVAYKYAEVEERDVTERFGLLSFPIHFDWDRSDHLLDPSRGHRVAVSATPFVDTIGESLNFYRGRISYTQYARISRRPDLRWAGRGVLGSIIGDVRDEIPADERFYAGGGGTIRGYEFQSVGPLDGKTPLGGKSIAVISSELRMRWGEDWGGVVFIDGGTVYESSMPDGDEDLRWGAGFGLRYFTPIGPLRVDIGFPLNKRSGVDDDFQFYISMGQAF